MAIDIGDKAIEEFSAIIKDAKTVLWNGPMGVFEMDCFAKGTKEIAEALADSSAISIVGGGDSVTAAKKFKVQDKLSSAPQAAAPPWNSWKARCCPAWAPCPTNAAAANRSKPSCDGRLPGRQPWAA